MQNFNIDYNKKQRLYFINQFEKERTGKVEQTMATF